MTLRWLRLISILFVLLLAGCFQQAGESLQPASNTAVPQSAPETSEPGQIINVTPTVGGTQAPVTSTVPPITIISPSSPTPILPTTTPSGPTPTLPQFITPVSPLGPEVETATPSLFSGDGITTPSGLITPTTLFSENTTSGEGGTCTYVVEPGDNLYRIAISHDTTVADMRTANPELQGENPILQPGQRLNLPKCANDQPESVELAPSTPTPPADTVSATSVPSSGETYKVQRGDTLFTIAQRFGTTVAALQQANNISDPNRISVGQELIIPG